MIQKDHFNKIQKKNQTTQEVAFKKATPPDGGEGARLRYFAPEGKLCKSLLFKSFDNASRRTKRQKGHCMELQGGALFWFSPKFTRQKFSNRENFFQLAPFLPTKFFHFSSEKIGKKVCALHLETRCRKSVSRY